MMILKINKNVDRKSFFHKLDIFLFSLIIVVLIAISYQLLSLNKDFKNNFRLATTVKPETFTELYFENHLNLPSKVMLKEPYSFSFTIHNLENQDMAYPYEVYIDEGKGKKLILDKNNITVQKNAFITIQEGFILNQSITRDKVIINLTAKNQQIDFWIEGITPPATKNNAKKLIKKPSIHKTPSKTPDISASTVKKQYGGWYSVPGLNKAMVWLGTDSNGQDIWSENLPQ